MKMLDIMNGIFLPLLLIPRISLRRKPTSFNILEIGFIISNETKIYGRTLNFI